MVSILSGEGKPALDWMRYAKSRSTRAKLRSYFRGKQRESLREAGEILLLDFLNRHKDLIKEHSFLEVAIPTTLNEISELLPGNTQYQDIDDLLIAIGKRHEWDFLRSAASKLLKVPLSILIDADEDQNRSLSKSVYKAVIENRQTAKDAGMAVNTNIEDEKSQMEQDLGFDREVSDLLYREVSDLYPSSSMLDLLSQPEEVDFDHLCHECLPMIGDEIIGTRPLSISNDMQNLPTTTHRSACRHAMKAISMNQNIINNTSGEKFGDSKSDDKDRIWSTMRFSNKKNSQIPDQAAVEVRWPDASDQTFLAEIVVISNDRKLLLADCGEVVSEIADIVKTASMTIDKIATFEFLVKVKCTNHLQKLMDALSEVESVMSVERRVSIT